MEFDHLLRGMEGIVTDEPPAISGLTPQQARSAQQLSKLPAFRNVVKLLRENNVRCTLRLI